MTPVLIPAEPAEIAALRSRLQADPNDHAARILFIWRCVGHQNALAAIWEALSARPSESVADVDGAEEAAGAMEAINLWFQGTLEEFRDGCERIKDIPDGALPRVVQALRGAMDDADFAAMDEAIGLAAMVDEAEASLPDQARLNDLRLRAFEPGADARTLFLTLDAIGEHLDVLCNRVVCMNAGEVAESPAWRRIAEEWFATMGVEVGRIGRLLEKIDYQAQTRAVAALRDELPPAAYDRLYERCGFAPV